MELVIPDSILHLTDSIRIQGDIITTISGVAIGFVLLTWVRVRGLASDVNLTGFRQPNVLILPLLLFLGAFILGYILSSALTGYFAEIVSGVNFSNDCKITDPKQHFLDDYYDFLDLLGKTQFWFSIIGMLVLSLWFILNLVSLSNIKKEK